jgi:outer membrane protein TolC
MTMNRNIKSRLLAGLLVPVLGMAVGTALAQTDKPADKPATGMAPPAAAPAAGSALSAQTFDQLDKNKDGKLSREEGQANPAVRDAWSKIDSANTGSVSKEDFEKYRATATK